MIAAGNRSLILGIDPGPVTSGLVVLDWEARKVCCASNCADNHSLLVSLCARDGILDFIDHKFFYSSFLFGAIEKVVPYGRSVGRDTMDTSWWGGKLDTAVGLFLGKSVAVSRPSVKIALYGSLTCKVEGSVRKGVDTKLLRECVKEYFEPSGGGSDPYKGTKAKQGPLYCVRGNHAWDALAVALAGKLL